MLTAGELHTIQDRVRRRLGVYLRLLHGPRYYDVVCMPDGVTWLIRITSDNAMPPFEAAIDGAAVEETLCWTSPEVSDERRDPLARRARGDGAS